MNMCKRVLYYNIHTYNRLLMLVVISYGEKADEGMNERYLCFFFLLTENMKKMFIDDTECRPPTSHACRSYIQFM